jgi:hypothetical protein
MADSSEHRDIQRQLEEKKQKLAELRAQKAAREKENGRKSLMPGECMDLFIIISHFDHLFALQ